MLEAAGGAASGGEARGAKSGQHHRHHGDQHSACSMLAGTELPLRKPETSRQSTYSALIGGLRPFAGCSPATKDALINPISSAHAARQRGRLGMMAWAQGALCSPAACFSRLREDRQHNDDVVLDWQSLTSAPTPASAVLEHGGRPVFKHAEDPPAVVRAP